MRFRDLIVGCSLLAASASPGQSIRFGTTNVLPHQTLAFFAPLTAAAKWRASRDGFPGLIAARGALVVPKGFTPARAWPVLVVSAGSGESSIRAMRGFTNVALNQGWMVLAADGPTVPVQRDHQDWHWAMLSSVLEQVHRCWPLSRQWPYACAGFSGGAKRSGFDGAVLMRERYRLTGLFMGGCNDDAASIGYRTYHPGESFKRVPVFLSNGLSDPIAGLEAQRQVRQSMERTGFNRIRTEESDGGHQLNAEHLKLALEWFYPVKLARQTNRPASKSITGRL